MQCQNKSLWHILKIQGTSSNIIKNKSFGVSGSYINAVAVTMKNWTFCLLKIWNTMIWYFKNDMRKMNVLSFVKNRDFIRANYGGGETTHLHWQHSVYIERNTTMGRSPGTRGAESLREPTTTGAHPECSLGPGLDL